MHNIYILQYIYCKILQNPHLLDHKNTSYKNSVGLRPEQPSWKSIPFSWKLPCSPPRGTRRGPQPTGGTARRCARGCPSAARQALESHLHLRAPRSQHCSPGNHSGEKNRSINS